MQCDQFFLPSFRPVHTDIYYSLQVYRYSLLPILENKLVKQGVLNVKQDKNQGRANVQFFMKIKFMISYMVFVYIANKSHWKIERYYNRH